jgi:hypothetical protein
MSNVSSKITETLTNAPLPLLIEKLGLAIANAQAALDANSIAVANNMAATKVNIDGKEFNLISLGFTPTFYAFTEASIEAKLEFSLTESESFELGVSVGVNVGVVAVSVNASYARKFEMSAEGSSSIAARMISLPPPDRLKEMLTEISNRKEIPVTSILVSNIGNTNSISLATNPATLQFNSEIEPNNSTFTQVEWSIVPVVLGANNVAITSGIATVDSLGKVTVTGVGPILVKATSKKYPSISGTFALTITA